MPVQSCTINKKAGYKYGESGKCYTYEVGDEEGRKRAKQKAYIQGAAISANTGEKMEKEMADVLQGLLDEVEKSEEEDKKINYDKFYDDGVGLIVTYPDEVAKAKGGNPNHDTKTGRFTTGGGVTSMRGAKEGDKPGVERMSMVVGPDGIKRQGIRATFGDKVGPIRYYIPGDRKSEDEVIAQTKADQKALQENKMPVQKDIHPEAAITINEASNINLECSIFKMDEEKQLVYGIVLVPNVEDLQGDIVAPEEIEAAAHDYMLNSQKIYKGHAGATDAEVVESYIAPVDIPMGSQTVPSGSWIMVTRVNDPQIWEMVKKGELTGYSIGGTGERHNL